jgi:hypothetical protein
MNKTKCDVGERLSRAGVRHRAVERRSPPREVPFDVHEGPFRRLERVQSPLPRPAWNKASQRAQTRLGLAAKAHAGTRARLRTRGCPSLRALSAADSPPPSPPPAQPAAAPITADLSIPDQISKLAELRDRGILTEDEFATKKAELLARM